MSGEWKSVEERFSVVTAHGLYLYDTSALYTGLSLLWNVRIEYMEGCHGVRDRTRPNPAPGLGATIGAPDGSLLTYAYCCPRSRKVRHFHNDTEICQRSQKQCAKSIIPPPSLSSYSACGRPHISAHMTGKRPTTLDSCRHCRVRVGPKAAHRMVYTQRVCHRGIRRAFHHAPETLHATSLCTLLHSPAGN